MQWSKPCLLVKDHVEVPARHEGMARTAGGWQRGKMQLPGVPAHAHPHHVPLARALPSGRSNMRAIIFQTGAEARWGGAAAKPSLFCRSDEHRNA